MKEDYKVFVSIIWPT